MPFGASLICWWCCERREKSIDLAAATCCMSDLVKSHSSNFKDQILILGYFNFSNDDKCSEKYFHLRKILFTIKKKLYRHFCFMQKISQQVFEEFLKLLCDYIAMRDYDHCTTTLLWRRRHQKARTLCRASSAVEWKMTVNYENLLK